MTEKTKKTTKKATQTVKRPPGRPRRMELDEIKNLEEPIFMPTIQKPRGRPKNNNYLPYEEAREFMRSEMIPSRNKYYEWWDRHKPKAIPRFPYRVYTREWTSWNDFLGTDNEFGVRVAKTWRPIEEAVKWVHKQHIESYTKWMEYCKEHTLPDDIPARPDLVYSTWRSWNHWLGNTVEEMIAAKKEAIRTQVFYVIHDLGVPENVCSFGLEPAGPTALKERWERDKFDVIRLFWYEPEQEQRIKQIIDALSTPYLGETKYRICPNMWEIIYYLEQTLQRITRL